MAILWHLAEVLEVTKFPALLHLHSMVVERQEDHTLLLEEQVSRMDRVIQARVEATTLNQPVTVVALVVVALVGMEVILLRVMVASAHLLRVLVGWELSHIHRGVRQHSRVKMSVEYITMVVVEVEVGGVLVVR
jgi:uncharacterized membrane protein YecN with MAPEG domain